MRTFVFIQLFTICLSVSFGVVKDDFIPLYMIVLAALPAQLFLWLYSFFKFRSLWYASAGFLSVSLFTAGLLFFISFVRTWRYFYFPVKEDLSFAFECLVRIPLQGVQLGTILLQGSRLREALPKRTEFNEVMYANMILVLFFHDFGYAILFAYYGGWYVLLGFTHFFVHIGMAVLVRQIEKYTLAGFMVVWTALLVQHVLTTINLYDTYWFNFVLGMNTVYVVALVMYLINGYLYLKDQRF